jgi:formate dehydrogenase subunit gamma
LTKPEGREGPILHDVEKAFGHVSEDAMREIAGALNLTRAEVYGMVSFYHDFRKEVETRPVIKVCRAEACKAHEVEALMSIADRQVRVRIENVFVWASAQLARRR